MADGQLEGMRSQFLFARRALSPVRPVLKVRLFLLLYYTGGSLYLGFVGVLTRLV